MDEQVPEVVATPITEGDSAGVAPEVGENRAAFYEADEVAEGNREAYDRIVSKGNEKFREAAEERRENQTFIDAGQLLMRAQNGDANARMLLAQNLGLVQPPQVADEPDPVEESLEPAALAYLDKRADARVRAVAQEYEERLAPMAAAFDRIQRTEVTGQITKLKETFGEPLVKKHSQAVLSLMAAQPNIKMDVAFRAVADEDIQAARQRQAVAAQQKTLSATTQRQIEGTLTAPEGGRTTVPRPQGRNKAQLLDLVRQQMGEQGLLT